MANWLRSGQRPSRRRHDHDELRRLIRRRESEGLSFAKLSKESGIPIGTLASWSHRVRQEEGPPARSNGTPKFVEVIPSGRDEPREEIEVRLPGGIVVQVPSSIDRPAVMRLLSAILSC